jgi:DNA-binding CsgD family transcriptional regulator
VGRREECAALDEVLASTRERLSATLVVTGDPGIGKTALLDYAASTAASAGFHVTRLTGFEPERDLGYAALQRLLRPVTPDIEALPAPQREALQSALGLVGGTTANRLFVGLGVTSLASSLAAGSDRLLCIFDDAQWIDQESIEALAFWGRRLFADGTALIFGARTNAASPLDGFPTLNVGRLSDEAAHELLAAEISTVLDRGLADRIVSDTEGNPLALLEVAKGLALDELVGTAAAPQPLPLTRRLEEGFERQVRLLPADSQMLLLLAAADSTADAGLVWDAAARLDITRDAAEPAEAAGLVDFKPHATFRHPLIRSAVYNGASRTQRLVAHEALAASTSRDLDPQRHAWHLAGATIGPNEEVAALLDQVGRRADAQGGHAAALALLSRSAELTPDPERAAERRVCAAEAAVEGNAPRQAHALVAKAMPDLRDVFVLARARRVEGYALQGEGMDRAAAPLLMSAGVELSQTDPQLGRETLVDALSAALMAGGPAAPDAQAIAAASSTALAADLTLDPLLKAYSTYVSAGFVAAAPLLRNAVSNVLGSAAPATSRARRTRAVLLTNATEALWDQDAHDSLAAVLDQISRQDGDLTSLAVALWAQANSELWSGRFASADIYYSQAADLFYAAGENPVAAELARLHLVASRGQESETRATAAFVIEIAEQIGVQRASTMAHVALVTLDLGLARYRDALEHAQVVFERDEVNQGNQVLADMIEAAVGAGDAPAADAGMDRLSTRAPAAGTPWARGMLARSQALMAGDDGEDLYHKAVELLASTRVDFDFARAHLLYGEWLRRQRRPIEAREHLRTAYAMFSKFGAKAFAERTHNELLASGEPATARSSPTPTTLTPQEANVARLAAAGDTNVEIAAQLYISADTVDYHLRKVYRKLSINSRRRLADALQSRNLEIARP